MTYFFYGVVLVAVLVLLGRLYLWWNFMFPQKGKIVSSGRRYRQKNIFLELMGGIKLILIAVVFLWLVGFFNHGSSNISNSKNNVVTTPQEITQRNPKREESSVLSELPKPNISPKEEDLERKSFIRNQIF